MNVLLPEPQTGQIHLVVAPSRLIRPILLELTARLALRGPVEVFDGGNSFNSYQVARSIRRQTPDLMAALQRIHIARVFTCYQAAALLARAVADMAPKLALDLLSTFYDENIAIRESSRLLEGCISHLNRFSLFAPVVVTVSPPSASQADRLVLVRQLQDSFGNALVFEPSNPQQPPRLF